MKRRFHMILMILLPQFIACNSINTLFPTTTPEILHFDNQFVAFDYPAGAKIYAAGDPGFNKYPDYYQLGGELVTGLANPGWSNENGTLFSSIGIFRHTLPANSSLVEVMREVYIKGSGPLPEEVTEMSGPFALGGWRGERKTYRMASGALWYTSQDIWLEKDSSILRISLNNEVFEDDFQRIADLFLGSLVIKDNLPPIPIEQTLEATASPTPYPATLLNPYDHDMLSFRYPKGMILLRPGYTPLVCFPDISFGGERLMGLGEPHLLVNEIFYRSIQITRREMPAGSNLEAVMLEVYEQAKAKYPQESSTLASTGPVTVAGQAGFQWAYRVTAGEPTYELRDIWLERDDQLYIISIWTEYTNPDDFLEFQSGAQALLESLVIK